MNTKNFWKIMGGGQLILTDCPDTFKRTQMSMRTYTYNEF